MFQPDQQIGPYTLLRLLGRGASGEVWLAEKRSSLLTTQVALKLPLDPDPDITAIQNEAQTWLHASGHPNVLPVIDAEVFDGQIAIASEYASGGSLKDWLKQHDGKAPSAEAAAAVVSGILAGLEHLHSLQPLPIIHRDLKSDNVLLQGGIPRLTDFGISRVLKTTAYTHHPSGTPSYMPPEAFEGKYSTQSDIWAVGVLLYQMLSGRLPFPQEDLPSLFGAIKQHQYDPLPSDVPQTLQKIVAKALAKDLSQRFASASEMREALNAKQRVAAGNNVSTRRVHEIASRAGYYPVVVSSLVAITALTLFTALKIKAGHKGTANSVSMPLPPAFRPVMKLHGHHDSVLSVAWSPDSKYIVTGTADGVPKISEAATGIEMRILKGHKEPVLSIAWSPDGKYIVTGTADGVPKVWDAATGREIQTFKGHAGWITSVAWSPDSNYLVTGSNDTTAKIWEAATGREIQTLKGNKDSVNAVAWSPDNKYILTGSDNKTATLWETATGIEIRTLKGHQEPVNSVAWSPDGKYIVTGSNDTTAKVWDAEVGSEMQTLRGHKAPVLSVAWSPDGRYLVTGSSDKTAKVWEAATGREIQTLQGHTDLIWSVAWSPDGKAIVTGSNDTTAKVWKAAP